MASSARAAVLTVREWLGKVAPLTQPKQIGTRWVKPAIGAMGRAQIIRKARLAGVVEFEPSHPVVPVFKGHKHERLAPMREASIAEKMKGMPARMEEHRTARRTMRRELKQKERVKKGLPPYHYPVE
jgi:hypothetical protein